MCKRIILLLLIICILLSVSGCWNYNEIDSLSIVAGVAVDIDKNKTYTLTVEVVEVSGGTETKLVPKVVSASGKTLFDSIRNLISINGKRIFWAHCKTFILSKNVLKNDLVKILDWYNRDAETRDDVYILVSNEPTAKEILLNKSLAGDIVSFGIEEMLNNQRSLSKAPKVLMYDFISDYIKKGIEPIAPIIKLVKNDDQITQEISGTAILSNMNLEGFLDGNDTRVLMFIRNEIKGGLFVVPEEKKRKKAPITLEIFGNKTGVKPMLVNQQPEINIELNTEVAIDEIQSEQDYTNYRSLNDIEKKAELKLAKDVRNLIKKVQIKYKLDIFGFGKQFQMNYPSEWSSLGKNWDNVFKSLKVNVISNVHIRNTGTLRNTFNGE